MHHAQSKEENKEEENHHEEDPEDPGQWSPLLWAGPWVCILIHKIRLILQPRRRARSTVELALNSHRAFPKLACSLAACSFSLINKDR
jgi:hypothetical protein